jgi:uncharacterized protein YbaP (TraB family)
MKHLFITSLLFLAYGCKHPQKSVAAADMDTPLNTSNSLLWKISGNGLAKPSYLYGTIHIIGVEDYFLGKNVRKKLVGSEVLVMETDLNNINVAELTKLSVLDSGKTIKDYMNAGDYEVLRSFMEDSIGIKKFTFEMAYARLKPFYIEQLIFFRFMKEKESYEQNFKQLAEEKNIPIEGLETFEEQLRFLEDIPLESQLKSLVHTIKNYSREADQLTELITAYKKQDLAALTKAVEEDEDQLMKKKLVDKRNSNWIPKLNSYMHAKQCFIAVGAAHLGGENGLIQLLQQQGYTVQPISIDN